MERVVASGSIAASIDVLVSDVCVEAAEERLDEFTTRGLWKGGIESARVTDELDGCSGAFGAMSEGLVGAGKALLDSALLERDLLQFLAQLWHGEVPVGEGVDESRFLIRESSELCLQGVTRLSFSGLEVFDDVCDSPVYEFEVLLRDAFRSDRPHHGVFKLFSTNARHGALAPQLG
ncbi:hypothetical protein RBR11_07485 [Microbacterium sp. ASV81]|uniref:Uncharacterized protein n=1 Tax=Microbacterium capsulatum TaxID=3041921 RepID=A0ABU0XFR7_9MICO|nr:hypothetical protein [Microbacterium sp. ASV81]MDQ4213757.1 hypothetical protein [Microbacterium sp. ASV81]